MQLIVWKENEILQISGWKCHISDRSSKSTRWPPTYLAKGQAGLSTPGLMAIINTDLMGFIKQHIAETATSQWIPNITIIFIIYGLNG